MQARRRYLAVAVLALVAVAAGCAWYFNGWRGQGGWPLTVCEVKSHGYGRSAFIMRVVYGKGSPDSREEVGGDIVVEWPADWLIDQHFLEWAEWQVNEACTRALWRQISQRKSECMALWPEMADLAERRLLGGDRP